MRRRIFASLIVFGLIAGACDGGSDSGSGESSAEVSPTSSAPATTAMPSTTSAPATTTSETTTSTTAASTVEDTEAFTQTEDLVYFAVGDVELVMDVYEPAGDGPWPVVVSFHGLSSEGKDDIATTVVAREAATQGMLVFTPTWIAGNPFPITIETFETWDDTVRCAVAFAQQHAAEYGGDSTTTVVDGFSAGAGAALIFASLEPSEGPVPGCETGTLPAPVSGFVLGDGEYTVHTQNFDAAFAADPEAMQARLAALVGPIRWQLNPDADFFLWVVESGTGSRSIGDPSDQTSWLVQRDPDGSIRADLERLGQLDDGIVSAIDAGQLLQLRLTEAGFNATVDEYPGGHTTQNKVSEIVGYLQTAAGG